MVFRSHLRELRERFREQKSIHETIQSIASKKGLDPLSHEFARYLDDNDELKHLREEFSLPKVSECIPEGVVPIASEEEAVYLSGNSLGLLPKRTRKVINEELDVWAASAAMAHFNHKLGRSWVTIEDQVISKLTGIVGAKPIEVAVMNTLTSNIHLLLASFYTPTQSRFKILIEENSFPSDRYALESQIKFHGYLVEAALVEIKPRPGDITPEIEDVLNIIEKEGDSIAIVFMEAVNYHTGQLFDIPRITKAAQKKGCIVAWNLAHAIGNVELKLHDWNVDLAVWCSYKYLNAGPGGIAGIFVHEKHAHEFDRPRFAGWWGHNRETRFLMNKSFQPMPGAKGFQVSNPSALDMAALYGSLEVFSLTNMSDLRQKSYLLTGYLEFLLDENFHGVGYRIITPRNPHEHGAQLSLMFDELNVEKIADALLIRGIICDERKQSVLRVAPAPLYNCFSDVYRFVNALKAVLSET